MARPRGSQNKPKDIIVLKEQMSNEDLFLSELVRGKAFWSGEAKKLRDEGKSDEKEVQYADAYRLLINQFTQEKGEV